MNLVPPITTQSKSISIGRFRISADSPVFIIAEAGVNHNGDIDLGKRLIKAAAAAGADAVKFQSFRANRLVTADAPKAEYQKATTGIAETQNEMLRRLELSEEDHRILMEHCNDAGVLFLSTPFDEESADCLCALGVPALKISSTDVTNLPLLKHVARKGLPVILSTGMSTLDEVGVAVAALRAEGPQEIILLHCVSNYPAAPESVNLRAMKTMSDHFSLLVGYSDHTEGIDITLAAVAQGARVIEKHFTMDKTLPGPDHKASLVPSELTALVDGIRRVEIALGTGVKAPADSELGNIAVVRRSVAARNAMPQGHRIRAEDLCALRPGTGIPPPRIGEVVGRICRRAIQSGEMIQIGDFE